MDSVGVYLKEDAYRRRRRLNNAANKRFRDKQKLHKRLIQLGLNYLGLRNRGLKERVHAVETGLFLINLCIQHIRFINLSIWMHKLGFGLYKCETLTWEIRYRDLLNHKGLMIKEVKKLFNRVGTLLGDEQIGGFAH